MFHTGTSRLALFSLEQRMMFDAAALLSAIDVVTEAETATPLPNNNLETALPDTSHISNALADIDIPAVGTTEQQNEIVFIDNSIAGLNKIRNEVSPDTQVFVIDSSTNGIHQVSNILERYRELSAIHIISHGDIGSLSLGNTVLNGSNLFTYEEALTGWGNSLATAGDILLYGCSVGTDRAGSLFTDQIAKLTGADVATSDDPTGAAFLGGDWVLEYESGIIETAAIEASSFNDILAAPGAHWGVGGAGGNAEVFLGGNYIELGINKAGNFGSTTAASAASVTGAAFIGANVSSSSLYSNQIGLSHDIDGFGEGTAESFDYFLPGTPYAQWRVGFGSNSATEDGNAQAGSGTGVTSVTETIPTTVTNESSGSTLQARITSTYTASSKTLGIVQVISFSTDDMYYTTEVTLTNNTGGGTSMSDVRYMWGVDPDQSRDVGGSYNTTNTITQTHEAGDNVARVLSSRLTSDNLPVANLFVESTNSAAKVNNDINRTDVYNSSNYDSAPAKNSTNDSDTGVGIVFDLGTLSDGASTTFSFITRLTNQSLEEVVAATATSETSTSFVSRSTPLLTSGTSGDILSGLTRATGGFSVTANTISGTGSNSSPGDVNLGKANSPILAATARHGEIGSDGLNTVAAVKGTLGSVSIIDNSDVPISTSVSEISDLGSNVSLLSPATGLNKLAHSFDSGANARDNHFNTPNNSNNSIEKNDVKPLRSEEQIPTGKDKKLDTEPEQDQQFPEINSKEESGSENNDQQNFILADHQAGLSQQIAKIHGATRVQPDGIADALQKIILPKQTVIRD